MTDATILPAAEKPQDGVSLAPATRPSPEGHLPAGDEISMDFRGKKLAAKPLVGWTTDQMLELAELARQSKTESEIAKALGKTDNAVRAMASRQGIAISTSAKVVKVKTNRTGNFAGWSANQQRGGRLTGSLGSITGTTKVAPQTFEEETAPPAGGVTLEDMEAGQCRWPIGDPRESGFVYCGARAEGTYCERHRKKSINAVQPPPPTKAYGV